MDEYLLTIPYNTFDLWDVKRYIKRSITSAYPIEPLGKHINCELEKINLSNYPEREFSILGISNEIGMHDAYVKKGKEFNQPYKVVKNGFIAYNPYRVNVGSIGIKTFEIKGNLISPAYVVFSCNKTLLPEFLYLLMKTNKFNELVKENTSGSVRQNLTFNALSSICIPIPTIDEQKEIISLYNKSISEAVGLVKTSWRLINTYYINTLKANNYELYKLDHIFLGTISFDKLFRWDSWINQFDVTSENYKVVSFGSLIKAKPQYGANVKGVDTPCDYRYIRITDINEDGLLNNEIKYPEKIEDKYVLNNNDFLIARSGNTVGKTFLYKKEMGLAIYAGYLVRYILNTDLIYPEYLLYYTKTDIFKNWVLRNQRISGQPNINGQEYLSCPVILPPLEKQIEISKKAINIFTQIKNERKLSEQMIKKAKQNFEDAIFKE